MIINIEEYGNIVGKEKIEELKELAKLIEGKKILMINSTRIGGGVAELISSYLPLFNDLNVKVQWAVIPGNETFFTITKKIHNALHGGDITITDEEWNYYFTMNEIFAKSINEEEYDLIVVHDPQPLPLILYHKHSVPWISRLHIDLSSPNKKIWNKMLKIIRNYDGIIVSSKEYSNHDLNNKKTKVIMPAIDPLKPKNTFISKEKCEEILTKFGINISKPIMAQVSRYDRWKDPVGVIDIFEMVKEKHKDLQLIILGNEATDDPEGSQVYKEVLERINKSKYKRSIFALSVNDELLVNAVQRRSDIIIQKSIKEGFGLVVSEAMYKYKSVIASKVGGIKLQIDDGINGFLLDPYDYKGFAERSDLLLKDEELRNKMGIEANKKAREHFMITRLVKDWLEVMIEYLH